jgi:hypothetical protein
LANDIAGHQAPKKRWRLSDRESCDVGRSLGVDSALYLEWLTGQILGNLLMKRL